MIYRISIPNFDNFRDDLSAQVRDAVSEITTWGFRTVLEAPGTCVLELESSPVNKAQLDWIAEKLLRFSVQYAVQDLTKDYVHVETGAPARYDGFGTTELFVTKAGDGKTDVRHVAVEKKHLDWQTGRYSSGLFGWRKVG